MKATRRHFGYGMFLALALCLAGCTRPPELVPVEGSLGYKTGEDSLLGRKIILAQAVVHATVRFVPEPGAPGVEAEGRTDPNGKFMLATPSHGRGALVGRYKVVLAVHPSYAKPVPSCYSDPEQTPFSVEVPPEGVKFLRLLVKNE